MGIDASCKGATKESATTNGTVDVDVRIEGDAHPVGGGSLTVEEWGRRWLSLRASEGVRSIKDDRNRWRTHVLSEPWAREPLATITVVTAREWLAVLSTKLTSTPKWKIRRLLAPSTIRNVLNLVRCCFETACELGIRADNPFRLLKLSRSRAAKTKRVFRVLRPAEQEIARTIPPPSETPILDVALYTCIRQGEQWSLRLEDVDLSESDPHLVIRFGGVKATRPETGTYVEIDGLFFVPTKGGRPRKVPLFDRGLDAMRVWMARLATYAPDNPHRLAFPLANGSPRRKGYAPYWFRKVVATLGRMRWHDWRHSGATSLLAGWWGVRWRKEELQLFLGHSSVTTTERYAHWLDTEETGLAPVVAAMRSLAKTLPVLALEEHMQTEETKTNGIVTETATTEEDGRRGSDSNRRMTVLQTVAHDSPPLGGDETMVTPAVVAETERRRRKVPKQKPGKSKQDYGTPWVLIRAIEARFGPIIVDLAASAENAKAPVYVTKEEDTFKVDWSEAWPDGNLFLNPEFSDITPYVAKCAFEQAERGKGRIILLVPAAVGSEWFANHVEGKARVITLRPRIPFDGCPVNPKTGKVDGYIKDCMLCVFGEPPGFESWRWDANVQPGAIINVGEVFVSKQIAKTTRTPAPESGHGAADGFGGEDFPSDTPVVSERVLGAAPLTFAKADKVLIIGGRFRGEQGEITAEGIDPASGRRVYTLRVAGGAEISPFFATDLDLLARAIRTPANGSKIVTRHETHHQDDGQRTEPLPPESIGTESARQRARRNLIDMAKVTATSVEGALTTGVNPGQALRDLRAFVERAVTLADIWIADAQASDRLRSELEDARVRLRTATGLLNDIDKSQAAVSAFLDREVKR